MLQKGNCNVLYPPSFVGQCQYLSHFQPIDPNFLSTRLEDRLGCDIEVAQLVISSFLLEILQRCLHGILQFFLQARRKAKAKLGLASLTIFFSWIYDVMKYFVPFAFLHICIWSHLHIETFFCVCFVPMCLVQFAFCPVCILRCSLQLSRLSRDWPEIFHENSLCGKDQVGSKQWPCSTAVFYAALQNL